MNLRNALAISCLALSLTGCAMAAAPVNGFFYSDVKGPAGATSNATSTKVGKAMCSSILGLFASGDASIEAAAKAGGITKIHHVDYQSYSVIGIYATFTTVVYGD
jgi:hypothetical protein